MGEPHRITEIYAWVVTEPDGGEGIPAFLGFGGTVPIPMIGSDQKRIESLREMAINDAKLRDMPLKLLRFSNMEVVEVIRAAKMQ